MDYFVLRLIERLPTVIPDEMTFYSLPEDRQNHYLGYCMVREAEEIEMIQAGVRIG